MQKYIPRQSNVLNCISLLENSTDFYCSLGIERFNKGDYNSAKDYFSKAISSSSSLHCFFHYQGAKIYYNMALLKSLCFAVDIDVNDIKHAIHLYHDFKIPSTPILLDPRDELLSFVGSDLVVFHESKLDAMYDELQVKFNEKHYTAALDVINEIIAISNASHFHYHVETSLQYYNRAICFLMLGREDIAISDIRIMLEFDVKNPHNYLGEELLTLINKK